MLPFLNGASLHKDKYTTGVSKFEKIIYTAYGYATTMSFLKKPGRILNINQRVYDTTGEIVQVK